MVFLGVTQPGINNKLRCRSEQVCRHSYYHQQISLPTLQDTAISCDATDYFMLLCVGDAITMFYVLVAMAIARHFIELEMIEE